MIVTAPWNFDAFVPEDLDLREDEALCPTCHITYNRHLPACPECAERSPA